MNRFIVLFCASLIISCCDPDTSEPPELCPTCTSDLDINGMDWPTSPYYAKVEMIDGIDSLISVYTHQTENNHDEYLDDLGLQRIPLKVGTYSIDTQIKEEFGTAVSLDVYEVEFGTPGDSYWPVNDGSSTIADNDVLNGVNTLDLIHLQRYLLGMDEFLTFDKFIAADINKSNTISVLDLLDLRKVILGISSSFPKNTSWRFGVLPIAEVFNSFSQFKETQDISILNPDTVITDFVGIKVGDLNGDVNLLNDYPIYKRESINILVNQIQKHNSNNYIVPFSLEKETLIQGFQFSIDLKDFELISISSEFIDFTSDNYSIIDGILRMSFNFNEITRVYSSSTLFTLELRAIPGQIMYPNIFKFSKDLDPEIYLDNMETYQLNLIENKPYSPNNSFSKIEILQNPFNQEMNLRFSLAKEQDVSLIICDLSGRCLFQSKKRYIKGQQFEVIQLDEYSGFGLFIIHLISESESWSGKVTNFN